MVFVSAELSRGRGERRSPAPRVALASASAARSLVPCACSSADRAGLFDLLGLRPLADDELVLHGVTQSRRKPPRRRCRPTSSLGRSDRPLALLLSSLFACSETLLSRFLVASQPVRDLLLCARHLFVAARTVWHRRQSSRGERDRVGCSSQFSLTGHLNRGIDGVFELVRVVGRGLISIAEVHAIVAGAKLAQSEPEMARDRFGFLERHEYFREMPQGYSVSSADRCEV